jgi:hypothetical protein
VLRSKVLRSKVLRPVAPIRAAPPVEVKPVFGGKSSATNGKFTVFSGGILTKSGGKKNKNTSIFFGKKEVN